MSNFNDCERIHQDPYGFIDAVAANSSGTTYAKAEGVGAYSYGYEAEAVDADVVAQRCAQAIVTGTCELLTLDSKGVL